MDPHIGKRFWISLIGPAIDSSVWACFLVLTRPHSSSQCLSVVYLSEGYQQNPENVMENTYPSPYCSVSKLSFSSANILECGTPQEWYSRA